MISAMESGKKKKNPTRGTFQEEIKDFISTSPHSLPASSVATLEYVLGCAEAAF